MHTQNNNNESNKNNTFRFDLASCETETKQHRRTVCLFLVSCMFVCLLLSHDDNIQLDFRQVKFALRFSCCYYYSCLASSRFINKLANKTTKMMLMSKQQKRPFFKCRRDM